MPALPTDRTSLSGIDDHVSDHNTLHGLNNSVGQANGVAQLGADGKLLPAQSATIVPLNGNDAPYNISAAAVDNAAGFNAFFADIASTKRPGELLPGAYNVRSQVVMPATALNPKVIGTGHVYNDDVCSIVATAAIAGGVVRVSAAHTEMTGFRINANQLADYGLELDSASESVFTRVFTQNAKLDGIHARAVRVAGGATNNDHITWDNCWSANNGTLFVTAGIAAQYTCRKVTAAGTVACTAGSQIVTGTGTAFTTLGIRPGDIIRIGATLAGSQYLQVETVDTDTQITVGVRRMPTATLSAQEYAIGRGDGYHEERHGDNNIAIIDGGLWRGNAGSAFVFEGLYGPSLNLPQMDGNAMYGMVFGRCDNASEVHKATVIGPYFEGNGAASFLFAMVDGITITAPLFGDTARYHVGAAFQNFGVIIENDTASSPVNALITPIGNGYSAVPSVAVDSKRIINIPVPAATPLAVVNWATYSSAAVIGGGVLESSGAVNASIEWDEALSAGTWTIELMHRQNVNRGIYSVQIDGVTVGTIDGYAAADVLNKRDSIAGVVVASHGVKRIKLLMATKNASSSAFYGSVQHLQLRRTA